MVYQNLIKPLLFRIDAERAHHLAMDLARFTNDSDLLKSLAQYLFAFEDTRLEQERNELRFKNPLGIAAGFDKNGEIIEALQAIGFGYIEIGSVTARPSTGNPQPRMFRLPEDQALINRMGLNNDGVDVIVDRIDRSKLQVPLGINIAKTHDVSIMGDAAIRDYVYSYGLAETKADYVMVNVSCPNTADGITFEDKGALRELLGAIVSTRKAPQVPMWVKFSPDLSFEMLGDLVEISLLHGVSGFALTNTTTNRSQLKTSTARLNDIGRGGLSGSPLRMKATQMIEFLRKEVPENITLIGIGGIDSGAAALERMKAGANLIQVYTGLVYEGPGLVRSILDSIVQSLSITDNH
jgi:dihydroorotate dehydrogenase